MSLPNVSSRVKTVDGHKLGYIRMLSFSEGVHAELARRGRKGRSAKAPKGSCSTCAATRRPAGRGGAERQRLPARGRSRGLDQIAHPGRQRPQDLGGNLPKLPIVVLIDRNTASAAEILTAALADDGGATVVGTRSYGKGVFQEENGLSNGGALKLTVGEYFTPDGVNLARSKGIHPDVQVSDDPRNAASTRGKQRALGRARRSGRGLSRGAAAPRARAGAGARAGRAQRPRGGRGAAARAARLPRLPRLARGRGRARGRARPSAHRLARRDLTALPTFTVDPATARDFDDAVSAQREGDGARVWIHIADVAAHVRPGSPLDLEARRRANSTYVPGRGRADAAARAEQRRLQPRARRRAPGGDGRDRARAGRRSRARRASTAAASAPTPASTTTSSTRSSPAARSAAAGVAEPLAAARDVAAALGEQRGATSLDVESFEPEFRFDAGGKSTGAHGVAQTESHRLIERLMILTNEQVAELLERARVPAIYRVHAQPDPARIERLVEQLDGARGPDAAARARGSRRGRPGEVAAEASRLVRREAARRGHGREAYTSLVLRSLKQAAATASATAATPGSAAPPTLTSPRRSAAIPTCVVHRALLAALGRGRRRRALAEAREVAADCSRAGARVGEDRARRRRRLRRLPARARAARARRRGRVRGRGLGRDPGRRLRFLRRRARRRLRGHAAGPAPARRALRAGPRRDGAGRPRLRGDAAPRRSDLGPRQPASTPTRGRVDLELADG